MYEKELKAMIRAAKIAEKHILKIYSTNFEVEIKSDDSPVTEADKGADKIIREELGKEFPEYGFLTEESKDTGERFAKEDIFIVDPVDGTKDFVARDGQFCTNIALAHRGEVVAGVINLPAKEEPILPRKEMGHLPWKKTVRSILSTFPTVNLIYVLFAPFLSSTKRKKNFMPPTLLLLKEKQNQLALLINFV